MARRTRQQRRRPRVAPLSGGVSTVSSGKKGQNVRRGQGLSFAEHSMDSNSPSRRAYEADSGTRLYGGPDELDDWDAKARASSWAAANRTFHLSLARSHAASGSRSGAVAAAAPSKSPPPPDLDAVQSLLGRLALQQSQETAQLVDAFEKRNRALWDSVEASIRQAEHEEGERQRALAEQRRKEEEAKRKAQELRDAEEKRAAEERKRNEEERKREEEEAEGRRKREEEERARKAEEERKLAAKASALGLPGPDAEGSPQAEFERWTAKMTVSSPRLDCLVALD